MNTLTRSLLPVAVAATLAACGGGGGYGGRRQQQSATAAARHARRRPVRARALRRPRREQHRRDRRCDRCGRQASSSWSARTCELFVGEGANKLTIGTVTPTAVNGGVAPIGLQDLKEVQNDNDQVLGNILVLLRALDADGDPTNGVKIDAAANAAVAKVDGGQDRELQPGRRGVRGGPGHRRAARGAQSHSSATPRPRCSTSPSCSRRAARARSRSPATTRAWSWPIARRARFPSSACARRTAPTSSEPLAEIPVGKEPRYVAISPDDKRAFVTSAVAGTMTVIDLTPRAAGRWSAPRSTSASSRAASRSRRTARTPSLRITRSAK